MVVDNKGNLFEERRRAQRRKEERRKKVIKVELDRRTAERRAGSDKRGKR